MLTILSITEVELSVSTLTSKYLGSCHSYLYKKTNAGQTENQLLFLDSPEN